MSTPEHNFEPMTTGMVLDKSFRLYLQNFSLLIGLSAILNIPLLIFTLSVRMETLNPGGIGIATGLVGFLLFILASFIITPLIIGATTRAVSDIYLGNIVTAGTVLSAAWRRALTLLKTQFIVGLIVGVGFILLIVPGILWFLSYALIAPVVMIEGSSNGGEIRRRSWGLVKGNRFKVFLIFVVLIVIQLLVQAGVRVLSTVGLGVGTISITAEILDSIVSILLTPLSAIAITLLYYDFRIRKEGFDLEMLSQSIGDPAPGA